jgi:hypothetical protein
MLSREQMIVLGIVWVAGWGFLFFRYPSVACRIFRRQQTEKRLRMARVMGAIGLGLASISVVLDLVWRN